MGEITMVVPRLRDLVQQSCGLETDTHRYVAAVSVMSAV
jgi:hypothetical protein